MPLGVSSVSAITFALAYGPSVRKIVEQPDILPGSRPRRAPRLSYAILRRPVDRAIVLFTARTIARSRQHRLLLAAYGGIGLAIAFAYGRDLLYGPSDIYARRLGTHWNQLNVPAADRRPGAALLRGRRRARHLLAARSHSVRTGSSASPPSTRPAPISRVSAKPSSR